MIIRKAKLSDARQCLQIAKEEKEKYWKLADFERCVRDKHAVLVVAEDGEKIVGYSLGFIVPTKRTDSLIHETRVHTGHRRNRVGTMLVDALCRELYAKGAKTIEAMIDKKHEKFYCSACGFVKTNTWIEVAKKKTR